ncbi:DUF551 domain-containing protein [Klebsiella michiganensis]|uniref:DUF551 domain-containing protein n=2 Tax=Klebsiella michiganensis TaxID=1134687 RepID=UPI003204BC5F
MPPEQPVEDSEPDRNPVLAYADSYRDMAKQGVESVPIWSVITDLERNIAPLYRHAQPVTVVPQDVLDALQKVARIRLDLNDFDGDIRGIADCLCDAEEALIEVVNRRAAMLQAQSDDDGEPTDDERIMAIEGIHNCERCSDEGWVIGEMGITRCACGQAGNSPVIPDGYVMVPKELTCEMDDAAWEAYHNTRCMSDIWDALLSLAPQLPGSEPATVPGKWIPVSEKLPERGDWLVTDGCDFDVQLFNGEQFIPGFVWEDKITHWMPLPTAPQEEAK